MVRIIRLAVIAFVGYWVYDIISTVMRRRVRRSPGALNIGHDPEAGHPNITGSTHLGKTEAFRDSDGAERRVTVGRGVIS